MERLKAEINALREEVKRNRGATTQYDITIKLLENIHATTKEVFDFLKKLARVPKPLEEAPRYEFEEEATPAEQEIEELIGGEYVEEE